jgi:release factor glutamine methyltransferase
LWFKVIYAPAEDSQLLLECVKKYKGNRALEIGVGSCIITEALLKQFSLVAGSDIDVESLRFCKQRGLDAHLACCDAASAFRGEFDLIVSNPPYLPSQINRDKNLETSPVARSARPDIAVEGGLKGIELTLHFIKSALPLLKQDGAILIVVSSHADLSALASELHGLDLSSKIVVEKKLFFEEIAVLEIRPGRKPAPP